MEFFFVEIFVGQERYNHDQVPGEDVLACGEGEQAKPRKLLPGKQIAEAVRSQPPIITRY